MVEYCSFCCFLPCRCVLRCCIKLLFCVQKLKKCHDGAVGSFYCQIVACAMRFIAFYASLWLLRFAVFSERRSRFLIMSNLAMSIALTERVLIVCI